MPRDYMPSKPVVLCDWCQNMMLEFAGVASGLGFTTAQILLFLTDLKWAIYACRSAGDAATFSGAWAQFRESVLFGNPGQPTGGAPANTMPEVPDVAAPAPGVIPRIRAVVQRIKSSPGYTPAIGETLRIITNIPPVDDTTAKPDTRGKALPMFKAELRCKRLDFDAVRTRCRRDGESGWTELGLSVGNSFVDERPPAEAGKPEVRTYEQIYVRDNQPVGQWSDSVRVTLQP